MYDPFREFCPIYMYKAKYLTLSSWLKGRLVTSRYLSDGRELVILRLVSSLIERNRSWIQTTIINNRGKIVDIILWPRLRWVSCQTLLLGIYLCRQKDPVQQAGHKHWSTRCYGKTGPRWSWACDMKDAAIASSPILSSLYIRRWSLSIFEDVSVQERLWPWRYKIPDLTFWASRNGSLDWRWTSRQHHQILLKLAMAL